MAEVCPPISCICIFMQEAIRAGPPCQRRHLYI